MGRARRAVAQGGVSVAELAKYLMVSRQNIAGLISRMERDGHIALAIDERDRRSRLVTMTDNGRHVWRVLALPKIHANYEQVLTDFSINDTARMLHYLLSILENMQKLDAPAATDEDAP